MKLHLPSVLLGVTLVSGLAVSGTVSLAAKNACASGQTCYDGHVLEFDPADGPVQILSVESTSLVTTSLDGQSTTGATTLVVYASDGDHYVQVGDPIGPYAKIGNLANVNAGDTLIPTKSLGGS